MGKLAAAANGEEPAPAANPKADTAYAQAQKAITSLNPTQKAEIIALLQKQVKEKPAAPVKKAAPATGTAPAAEPATQTPAPAAPAAEPAANTTAAPTKPKRAPRKKAATAPAADATTTPAAEPAAPAAEPAPKKKRAPKKAAGPTQAEIDADRERIMGNFTDSVERHKKAMLESAIRSGEVSFFRKK
jgi:hypothetical protein